MRNILDKIIHLEDQETINGNMSQYQVGNQKKRSIRDHTLIIHAVLHEARSKNIQIDIIFTDIKQCFDSVWLEEAINDLYLSGIDSRNLNLLYESNTSTSMCVESSLGKSDRVTLNNIVMQGSVSGGTLCSNQLSKLCKETHNEGIVYMFRNKIPIPSLAMVDDIATMTLCNSIDSVEKNIKTNEFIKRKKLESQVGEGKCQWLHSGKEPCRNSYIAGSTKISQCDVYKYLGDHVADGFNPLYKKRVEKAVGYSVSCTAMCTEMSLGYQFFSIAKLLLQSIFLNGVLVKMETWVNFTTDRIEQFERVEQGYLRKILQAHSKTPTESLYLELGVVPFRYHLMSRRILYYQTIMQRNEDEITRMVVESQKMDELKGDFYSQVKEDMKNIKISESLIQYGSNKKLSDIIKENIKIEALRYLKLKASSHSKIRGELYNSLEGKEYFFNHRLTSDKAKLLFQFRTRMFGVRNNFRNMYSCILCPLCGKEDDTQQHLVNCEVIQCYEPITFDYEDIFSDDSETLVTVANKLARLVELREEIYSSLHHDNCNE